MTSTDTPAVKRTPRLRWAILALVFLPLLGVFAFIWFGAFNFAGDVPHSKPVYSLIEFVRERSVEVRAAEIKVPALNSKEALIRGAGNYEAMCVQCHLAPGRSDTELSRGLYPSPPNLSRSAVKPAEAFWTIKHGIKASGMPAWGKSMTDADIWNLVAIVQQLPSMDSKSYKELVGSSTGHAHAGAPGAGEEMSHSEMEADGHTDMKQGVAAPTPAGDAGHPHKDGETH